MTLLASQDVDRIKCSSLTLLFLAWKSTAKTEALLGTVAAYPAVMVVFVGCNSNQTKGKR